MYIDHTMWHNYGGFTLDTASISNTSASKTKITLPYTGKLPADLNNATGAAIVITLQVGLTVKVLLTVEQAGKKLRYPVTATPKEIDRILHGFFFTSDGHTRRDTSLDRYSLGLYQGCYVNWKRLTLDAHGLNNLLPPAFPRSRPADSGAHRTQRDGITTP